MYFNDSNSFFHGIMFHHFHDNKNHGKAQGSISADFLYSDGNIWMVPVEKNNY